MQDRNRTGGAGGNGDNDDESVEILQEASPRRAATLAERRRRALAELRALESELAESRGGQGNSGGDLQRLQEELGRLELALSGNDDRSLRDFLSNRRLTSDIYGDKRSSSFEAYKGHLATDHPARMLPPVDLLFLVDSSSSIGIVAFNHIKSSLSRLLEDVDVAPGRSRVALIQFAQRPSVVFGFDKYYALDSMRKAIERTPYSGGSTFLAKALNFASGILWHEQNLKDENLEQSTTAPTPRHDRLQVLLVYSDGASEDDITAATAMLHENLQVRVAGVVTRARHRPRLVPVTRFDGAVFVVDETESINIWLWRQQRLWMDNYATYLEREKTLLQTARRTNEENRSGRTARAGRGRGAAASSRTMPTGRREQQPTTGRPSGRSGIRPLSFL